MGVVSTQIEIGCSADQLWQVVTDPGRLGEWVTLHRETVGDFELPLQAGTSFKQRLSVGSIPLNIDWTVTEISSPNLLVWSGKGPMASRAEAVYKLSEPSAGRTLFRYRNEFKLPGGPLGAVAARLVTDAFSKREAELSLRQLKQLLENTSDLPSVQMDRR